MAPFSCPDLEKFLSKGGLTVVNWVEHKGLCGENVPTDITWTRSRVGHVFRKKSSPKLLLCRNRKVHVLKVNRSLVRTSHYGIP